MLGPFDQVYLIRISGCISSAGRINTAAFLGRHQCNRVEKCAPALTGPLLALKALLQISDAVVIFRAFRIAKAFKLEDLLQGIVS